MVAWGLRRVVIGTLASALCLPPALAAHATDGDGGEILTDLSSRRLLRAQLSGVVGLTECGVAEPPLCTPPPEVGSSWHLQLTRWAATWRPPGGVWRPRDLHLRGLAELHLHAESRDVGEAVASLRQAAEADPESPELWNDLAAAYLAQAAWVDPWLNFRALWAADRALELDPEMEAARFNRALALTGAGLPADSAWLEAWRVARPELRKEVSHSLTSARELSRAEEWNGWVERLESGGLAPSNPFRELSPSLSQQVRIYLEEVALPAWGQAVVCGDEVAATRRLALAADGVAWLARQGQSGIMAASVERLVASRGAARRELARGHQLYGVARQAYERQDYDSAVELLREADRRLERQRSPFVFWARFYRLAGRLYSESPAFEAVAADLKHLDRSANLGDPVARAYSAWMIGYCYSYLAEWADTSEAYRRAEADFATAGERENRGMMINQVFLVLRQMGLDQEAKELRGELVTGLTFVVKPRRLMNLLETISSELSAEGLPRQALSVGWYRFERAEASENTLLISMAAARSASLLADLREVETAGAWLERAISAAREIPQAETRTLTELHLAGVEARVLDMAGRPFAAASVLERAIVAAEVGEVSLYRLPHLISLARLQHRQMGPEAALGTLSRADAELLRQRAALRSPRERSAYLDQARVILETKIGWMTDAGRWLEAWKESERWRALELASLMERRPALTAPAVASVAAEPPPLGWRRLTPRPGSAVVTYLSLRDRLLRWRWGADGRVSSSVVWITREDLEARVQRVRASIDGARAEGVAYRPGGDAEYLALVIFPAEWLQGVERLLIVADGPLHELHFPSLPLPNSPQELLLERVAVTLTPSIRVAQRLAGHRAATPLPPSPPLLVGVPAFSSQDFPFLPALNPEALARVRRSLGPSAVVLSGAAATPGAFLEAFPAAPWVVYMGHSLARSRGSQRSGLVLAADPGNEEDGAGLLGEERILGVRGAVSTRLLVLGSCSGAAGSPSLTEGPLSLVRPFLGVGVPAVIASLGEVEEAAVAELLSGLEANCADDPAQCLRRTQLAARSRGAEADNGAAANGAGVSQDWLLFQNYGTDPWVFAEPVFAEPVRAAPGVEAAAGSPQGSQP